MSAFEGKADIEILISSTASAEPDLKPN